MSEGFGRIDLNVEAGLDVVGWGRPRGSNVPPADSARCKPASLARRPIVLRVVGDVDARDQRRVCLGNGVDRRIRLSTISETSEQGTCSVFGLPQSPRGRKRPRRGRRGLSTGRIPAG